MRATSRQSSITSAHPSSTPSGTSAAPAVASRVEEHGARHEADDLRAGDAEAALARALLARVEGDVQRRHIEIREVDRHLRAAELRNDPADRLDRLEDARLPHRLALRVE